MAVFATSNGPFTVPGEDLDSGSQLFGTMHQFYLSKHWNRRLWFEAGICLWNRSKGTFALISSLLSFGALIEPFFIRTGHHRSVLMANRHYRNGCDQCLLFSDNSYVFVHFLLVLKVTPSPHAAIATTKQHSAKLTQPEHDRSAGIAATTQLCRIWFLSVLISISFLIQFSVWFSSTFWLLCFFYFRLFSFLWFL